MHVGWYGKRYENHASSSPMMSRSPEHCMRKRIRIPAKKANGYRLRMAWALLCALSVPVHRVQAEETVAISAKVSNGYVRKKLPDGTFQVETYAFGKGDEWSSARVDHSTDKLDFMTVAKTVAVPLADRNYLPTHDQKTAKLLIMVYWGTTRAPEKASDTDSLQKAHDADREQDLAQRMINDANPNHPAEMKAAKSMAAAAAADMRVALVGLQGEQQQRENKDAKTVALLGYDSWWLTTESASGGGERAFRKQDMLDEIEEDRYFVILMAYDFQEMMKNKKSKLLWEVHMSIREHSNEFDKRLQPMAVDASQFFGQDSGGLKHIILPDVRVDVGQIKSLGEVPGK